MYVDRRKHKSGDSARPLDQVHSQMGPSLEALQFAYTKNYQIDSSKVKEKRYINGVGYVGNHFNGDEIGGCNDYMKLLNTSNPSPSPFFPYDRLHKFKSQLD
ncbi:hypothetical protein MTR_5g032300 [Medicago truncatula]|uniref:Uncharacterized protein n=1 Tax=Medicago truncatula TaxID=3880 RepID=G7JXP0_MEDTR|nr:hypothetical protein MTR_5g032300 [Medicago truncatula]